jgi:hypothetical protein
MRRQPADLERVLADKGRVETALRAAVSAALVRHKRAGNPVVVWRNGKVIRLRPEEIPEPPEKSA